MNLKIDSCSYNITQLTCQKGIKSLWQSSKQLLGCQDSLIVAIPTVHSAVTGRKNFLFHDTADGATVSAIVLSLIETAKANNLNIYHYLYTLLLYMLDYKNEPAGIKQQLPWSDFIKERCTGIIDIEKVRPEERGNLNI